MLSRLAERYGMLVAQASEPARRFGDLRRMFSGQMAVQMSDWRRTRRRGQQMKMAHLAITSLPENDRFRQMAFTFAVIALAAKLAQVDGQANEREFITFRDVFLLPPSEHEKIRSLFKSASQDGVDALVYARQICALFPPAQNRKLLKDVLLRLLAVATADGPPGESERHFLRRVAGVFGLKPRAVSRLLERHEPPPQQNPYALLQARKGWNDRQIRQAYLHLIRDAHPDKVQARGGSKEAVEAASRHMALLNSAYALICTERGLKGDAVRHE